MSKYIHKSHNGLLFRGNYRGAGGGGAFDFSGDASEFIMIQGPNATSVNFTEQTQLVVVDNWFEELKRFAPPYQQ